MSSSSNVKMSSSKKRRGHGNGANNDNKDPRSKLRGIPSLEES